MKKKLRKSTTGSKYSQSKRLVVAIISSAQSVFENDAFFKFIVNAVYVLKLYV